MLAFAGKGKGGTVTSVTYPVSAVSSKWHASLVLQTNIFVALFMKSMLAFAGTDKAGTVTSVTQLPDGSHIGLGYVRCRAKGMQIPLEGLQLTAAGVTTRVVNKPFARWHFPEGQGAQEPAPEASGDLKDRALAAK